MTELSTFDDWRTWQGAAQLAGYRVQDDADRDLGGSPDDGYMTMQAFDEAEALRGFFNCDPVTGGEGVLGDEQDMMRWMYNGEDPLIPLNETDWNPAGIAELERREETR